MERTLPHNLEAERAVLGALLLDPRAFDVVLEILSPDDFYSDAHRLVYQSMVELESKGTPIDLISLVDNLKGRGALEKVGGEVVVASLADGVASAVGIEHWAKLVREKALLRRVINEAAAVVEEAYTEPEDVDIFLDYTENRFLEISAKHTEQKYITLRELLKSGIDLLQEIAQRKQLITGVPSGYDDLDKYTFGFQAQELIIIAGRPSMGKSALALNIARNAAVDYGKSVAFFSLEMSKEQLLIRLMSSETEIDQNTLRSGFFKPYWEKVIKAAGKLSPAKLYVDDSSALSVLEMKSRARRIKAEFLGLDLVVVDYLQLISPALIGGKRRAANREQEVSEISRSLKAMAKELKVPVIALSQLNRQVEHRDDKRPRLADLRESGAIEQDADVILFVHRPGMYYLPPESSSLSGQNKGKKEEKNYNPYAAPEEGTDRDIPDDRATEIIIGKQRNGPTGIVSMNFFKEFAKFKIRETRDDFGKIPEKDRAREGG